MEKLIINHFAGIEYLAIEIKKINIIIGPQASGKSICAKLLYYFKEFIRTLILRLENDQIKLDFNSLYIQKFLDYFPPQAWGENHFLIRYELNNDFIQISREDKNNFNLNLTYSENYTKLGTELKELLSTLRKKQLGDPNLIFFKGLLYNNQVMFKHCQDQFGNQSTFSQIFIPAGRSFFANLQNNIFSILSNNNSLEPFLRNFGSIYENLKSVYYQKKQVINSNQINKESEIDQLVEKILCGKYIFEQGEDFIILPDARKINIINSSSGQQETLPLTIILSTLLFLTSSGGGNTVYIEEPEAHLFPDAQKNIVELIATVFNYSKDQLQFFITTHSPYILTATNNLLQAGILEQQLKLDSQQLEKLQTIIPKSQILLPEDVKAYSLNKGKCDNIISEETGLIDGNIIDAVSNDLAIKFDKLLEFINLE